MGITSSHLHQPQLPSPRHDTFIRLYLYQVLPHLHPWLLMEDYLPIWCSTLNRTSEPFRIQLRSKTCHHRLPVDTGPMAGTIHPGNTFNLRPQASSSTTTSRMPPASSINPQQASSSAHPDVRSSKRQRVAAMMATEGTVEASPPSHKSNRSNRTCSQGSTIATDDSEDTDFDQSAAPLPTASTPSSNPIGPTRGSETLEAPTTCSLQRGSS